jgi:hypothetical protein
MHQDRKDRAMKGKRGGADAGDKTIVMGVLERASEGKPKRVRASIISDRKKSDHDAGNHGFLATDSKVYTDEFGSSWNHLGRYDIQMVNHAEKYVDGQIHWRTSGACSSALLAGPTSQWNRSTCSAISTNRHTDLTIASTQTENLRRVRSASVSFARRSSDGDSTYKELTGKEGETEAF